MLKLLVLCALIAFCVEAQITTGAARNLQTFAFPPQNPRLVEVVGVSRTKNNVTKTFDAVQFLLNTLGEATLQFNYFASSSGVTNGANPGPKNTASNFAIAFRTFAVFEFDNNDGVPGFQETQGANKDTITGVYNLNSLLLPWNPLVLQQEVKNGVNVTTLTAQTKDEVFLLKLVFSGNPTQVGSVAITPDQVKVDFVVKWFNNPLHVPSLWTTGPSNATVHPNAQVGLATITASESGTFSHVNGTNAATFQFTRSNYSTALQYANNVTVDQNGVQFNANVHVHVTSTTNNQNVQTDWAATWVFKVGFFSFEAARPSMVWWDPVLGADTMPTVAPTGGVSALSPLVLLVLLALLFIHA